MLTLHQSFYSMSISRRTRNSLSSLSDEDVQRLATHSSTVESSVTSSPQPAVSDSSSTPASSPPLSAATSSTQLLASSFCTTRLAQQHQTAPQPTTPSASDLLRAPSSLLLNSSVVRPPSSLPLPYVPPNTWPRASFVYVPSSMAFAPGVSTSGSSQVMQQSFSPPPSLFTFQPSSAVQPVSQAPILPQSAVRAPHNSADNGHGFIGYPKGQNVERALGPRCPCVLCIPIHIIYSYQYRVILGLSHFSLTGTVSTSPNLAEEGARSATIITRPSGSCFS